VREPIEQQAVAKRAAQLMGELVLVRGSRTVRMSRRKGEINARKNERDFPHIVELQLELDGFHDRELDIAAFHQGRGIPVRRGRGIRQAGAFSLRFCFPDAATATSFQEWFGGQRLPKVGQPKGDISKRRRRYSPRIIDGKAMTPTDLRRLHKHLQEMDVIEAISDDMRAVVESEWPELVRKLRPKKPHG
jgi:hypothetical protein